MKYKVKGSSVTLELSAEEINEVIEALESFAPNSEVLAAFRQFRKEEFA
jgi:hypothetical protein